MRENAKSRTTTYWLPRDVIDWLRTQAEAHDRSASWTLTQIVRAAMAAQQVAEDTADREVA